LCRNGIALAPVLRRAPRLVGRAQIVHTTPMRIDAEQHDGPLPPSRSGLTSRNDDLSSRADA